jgi:hypothetical protein
MMDDLEQEIDEFIASRSFIALDGAIFSYDEVK